MARILVTPERVIPAAARGALLAREDLEVRCAATATQALKQARAWKPSLIIFSSGLRDVSADEFCRHIREDLQTRETRLLMVTDELGDAVDCLVSARTDSHLVNPVHPEQISETVATLLSLRIRRGPRADVDILAELEGLSASPGASPKTTAGILSISDSGVLVESPTPLQVGSFGKIRFTLPNATQACSCTCVVAVMRDEILLRYGIEFSALSAATRARIKAFVSSHSAGQNERDLVSSGAY